MKDKGEVMGITIVGLGPGKAELISLGAYRALKRKDAAIWLRTKRHPTVEFLLEEGISFQTMDHQYQGKKSFEEVYDAIVRELLDLAEKEDLVYAVPGNPWVAESTVPKLKKECKERGIPCCVVESMSFVDAVCAAAAKDPLEGFTLLDALALEIAEVDPCREVLVAQVYDGFVASEVKLKLLEVYEADRPVLLIHGAGTGEEKTAACPLHAMDAIGWEFGHLTSVWIFGDPAKPIGSFARLLEIIAELRGEHGCPWDKKQTHQSLKKYLLEEAQELAEAIDEGDEEHMVEELGDVLLQVVLHGQIGRESGFFDLREILKGINEKMIRRHPHVFGGASAADEEAVLELWQEIKMREKQRKSL